MNTYDHSDVTAISHLLQDYFDIIAGRPAPAAQSLARHDRILSIQQAGPNTALATVQCAIPPRYFTDYLTVMKGPNGWQIVSKSFHTDVHDGA